ncbi:MAG: hypothetical protein GWP19_09625 [Planctomycetia bacterium]|nr:hypothetical protein [Planctomycetia bacterium]
MTLKDNINGARAIDDKNAISHTTKPIIIIENATELDKVQSLHVVAMAANIKGADSIALPTIKTKVLLDFSEVGIEKYKIVDCDEI